MDLVGASVAVLPSCLVLAGCALGAHELVVGCEAQAHCHGELCERVPIPRGELSMGADEPPPENAYWSAGDERPIHRVKLDAFCIDKHEVTLGQYERCVDDNSCDPSGLKYGYSIETVVNHYPRQCAGDLDGCQHYPVNAKSYAQAQTYCAWQGGRLCTEAEWERAANGPGPQRRIHPWGDEPPTAAVANVPSVGPGYIEPAGSHPAGASVEGVLDLAGNVYEWVRDAYAPYPAATGEPLVNPVTLPADDSRVVARGACFFTEPVRTVTERTHFEQSFDWG